MYVDLDIVSYIFVHQTWKANTCTQYHFPSQFWSLLWHKKKGKRNNKSKRAHYSRTNLFIKLESGCQLIKSKNSTLRLHILVDDHFPKLACGT